jgi:hypothetical protein
MGRSVYNMASLGLDNTWVQSQDKAIKAGRLLGEVLEKRVQGQRPVILVRPPLPCFSPLTNPLRSDHPLEH